MLVNRLIENARSARHVHRELARRARETPRRPVIIVPPVMGCRLVDDRGRQIWGATLRLFGGDWAPTVGHARPAGLVDGFTLIPRLYQRDVFGGLVRYLQRIYGADVFCLDYDWRQPLADGAAALARLVARVRGAGDEQVDLIGISSGGLVIRHYLAGEPNHGVHRIIYMGTPHRGSFSALSYLIDGLQIVRQHADGRMLQRNVPGIFDLLPAPGERVFVDTSGRALDLDHLDPVTWRELRLAGHDLPGLAGHLARATEAHARVARIPTPPAIVIADRHRPTATRVIVDGGHVIVPCGACKGDPDKYPYAFEPGDGVVSAATMASAPGLSTATPWWVETSEHARIATDPHVHPLVAEALLSPDKPVPRETYVWPKNPFKSASAETAS